MTGRRPNQKPKPPGGNPQSPRRCGRSPNSGQVQLDRSKRENRLMPSRHDPISGMDLRRPTARGRIRYRPLSTGFRRIFQENAKQAAQSRGAALRTHLAPRKQELRIPARPLPARYEYSVGRRRQHPQTPWSPLIPLKLPLWSPAPPLTFLPNRRLTTVRSLLACHLRDGPVPTQAFRVRQILNHIPRNGVLRQPRFPVL